MKPLYEVPVFDFHTSLTQLPWFLVLGIFTGVMGAVFLKLLRWSEEFFQNLKAPIFTRMALGGLVVGLIAIQYLARLR